MNTKEKIASAFIRDIATRYSLPELLTLKPSLIETDLSLNAEYGVSTKIQPSGQLSAFVRKASVVVIIIEDTIKNGFFYGELKFSYEHPCGGFNGYNTKFYISTDEYSKEYIGAIEENLYKSVQVARR